jgi:uncharacterized protein involved in exopolysaccharide biosynthesis
METELEADSELLPYPFGSPRDILTALFKQKFKILLIFLVVFLGVAAWVFSSDTLYESRATLILKFGRENIFRPEIGEVDQIVQSNSGSAVESERKIIESRDLVRRVVEIMGVENLYPEIVDSSEKVRPRHIEAAASKFIHDLETSTEKGTNLIEIIFLHERPKVGEQALKILVEALKERHLQVFSDPKASFLLDRLHGYEQDLENAERNLQEFKQKHDLSSPLEGQQQRLLDQRSRLDTNHQTIKNQLHGLESKALSLESQMKTIPEQIPLSTTEGAGLLDKAKAALFDLKRQEQGLLSKYTEDSVPIQNLQKEIKLVEQFIIEKTNGEQDKRVTSGKNPIYQQLEITHLQTLSEIKTLKASNEVIASQIEDLDKKLFRLDGLNEEFVGLERKRASAEQNYQLYLEKVEAAQVSEEMDRLKMSAIGVIQAAKASFSPAGRSKGLKLALGALFATIMSVGLALVMEYFDEGYTTPDRAAEDLGLPVLMSFNQKG